MKGVKRVELKGVDVSAACQGFAEQISSRQLVHGNDPRLTPTSSAARSWPAETAGNTWKIQNFFSHEARAAHGVRIRKARYSFTLRREILLSSGWSGSSARQMALWSPCRQSQGYGVA